MLALLVIQKIAAIALVMTTTLAPAAAAKIPGQVSTVSGTGSVEHKFYGTVASVNGTTLIIRTRSGEFVSVDGRAAHSFVLLRTGRPVIVFGTSDASGVVHARAIWHTYPDAAHWPADR